MFEIESSLYAQRVPERYYHNQIKCRRGNQIASIDMVVSREERCPRGVMRYVIQDMYNDCETLVSTRAGETEYFHVGVGLHQGSSLSPLPFILIMDVLQAEIGKEPPWVMLFADDWSFVNIVEQKLSCS